MSLVQTSSHLDMLNLEDRRRTRNKGGFMPNAGKTSAEEQEQSEGFQTHFNRTLYVNHFSILINIVIMTPTSGPFGHSTP